MFRIWYYLQRRTPQSYKPVILVTGSASGIGFAVADLLYHHTEYRIAITARQKSLESLKLKFTESDRFIIRALDVTKEQDRESLVKEIETKWGGVDILINNAGISYRAVVEHMSEQDEFLQMNTNYLGPVGLIRSVLPHMRKVGRGKIINISSVSGMLAMPTMASYSASKYALEGMSEALWYEARPLGINVSLIQPGFIHSNSFKNVYYTEKSRPEICVDGVYCDYYHHMSPFIEKLMRWSWATPDKIAKLVYKVIRTEDPPLWIAATFDASVFYYLRRIIPRRLLLPLLFWLLPKAKTWGKAYTHKRILP